MQPADSRRPRLVFRDASRADSDGPREPDGLEDLLLELQLLIFRHPVAAQALFQAFVTEGRTFARTPEGQRWAATLADSPLVRRGRMVWDVTTLRTLVDDPDTVLPSAIVDAFVKAVAVDALEPLLSRLFEGMFDGRA